VAGNYVSVILSSFVGWAWLGFGDAVVGCAVISKWRRDGCIGSEGAGIGQRDALKAGIELGTVPLWELLRDHGSATRKQSWTQDEGPILTQTPSALQRLPLRLLSHSRPIRPDSQSASADESGEQSRLSR